MAKSKPSISSAATSASLVASLAERWKFQPEQLKNHAAGTRRARTTLANVVRDISDGLDAKQKANLEAALATLADAAVVYDQAHGVAATRAADLAKRTKVAEGIAAAVFGHLTSYEDTVALLAAFAPEALSSHTLSHMTGDNAKRRDFYAMDLMDRRRVFETIAYGLASREGDMQVAAAELLARFTERRPSYELKYASFIVALRQVLAPHDTQVAP